MSQFCPRVGGEGEQQLVVGGVRSEVSAERGGCLSFYHVPQQCRREKLRYPNADERPRWPPHAIPSPSSPFHCRSPFSAATATVTASFMPSSSTHVLHPTCNATPDDHGFTPILLVDHHHPLFDGTHSQVEGIALSLSSAASPSDHSEQRSRAPAVCASVLTRHQPVAPIATRCGPIPTGPFTGYAAILHGSRFLKPAQQLLEDVCGGGSGMTGAIVCSGDEVESLDLTGRLGECSEQVDSSICDGEHREMKSRLVSLLDEVCRRYKQYHQQIQAVIRSFEAVAGLNTAAPYTFTALRSLSNHFKCLKSAISDQLRFMNKALGKQGQVNGDTPGCGVAMNSSFCYQRVAHSPGTIKQQPVWRPQRGLPERAVTVLRAWLFEHFLHPYPTDMDKQMLAKQTGLSRNQVSNWFINARVRLWKPMVEEIHSIELQQAHNIAVIDEHHETNKDPEPSSISAIPPGYNQTPPSIIPQKIHDPSHKRLRDELPQLPSHIKEPLYFASDDFPTHHRVDFPTGFSGAAANGGISLTLGLHQNDSICLSEQLPLNVVHRFGLEETGVPYVMGGFEGQERHLGRDLDGQLLRHFVA